MKIKDLPTDSRPREKFLKHGPEYLTDSELLTIILRTGYKGKINKEGKLIPGENIIEISNRLINEHTLNGLFDCSLKELQQIKGISP